MFASGQKFQRQRGLVGKLRAWSNHRTTLPQLRCAQQLPQRGSRGGVRTIHRAARKPQDCGRFSSPLRNSKTVSLYHSTKYTPSVSLSLDSSLREGAGNGCVPFIVPPGKRKVSGDFHRPYETQKPFSFTIQRTTLPQSASLTAPSEREPGRGAHHSSGYSLNRKVAGDFHRPYERRFPFIGGHSLRGGQTAFGYIRIDWGGMK